MSLSRIITDPNYNLCDPPRNDPPGLYTLRANSTQNYIVRQTVQRAHDANVYDLGPNGSIFCFENVEKYPSGIGFKCHIRLRATKKYLGVSTNDLSFITDIDEPQEWNFMVVPDDNYTIAIKFGGVMYFLFYLSVPSKYVGTSLIAITDSFLSKSDWHTKLVLQFLNIASFDELNNSIFIVGNFICNDPPCVDTYPTTDINYCNGDCVDSLTQIDANHWQCNYDMNKITSNFLKQWNASGWPFPDWTQEQKDNICTELDNPFNAPDKVCGGKPTVGKDQYCLHNFSTFFSPECLDYIKSTQTSNNEIRTIFADKLDEICPKVKAGVPLKPQPSEKIMKKIVDSCQCVLTDAQKKQAITKLRNTYEDDGHYLNALFAQPVNCWLDNCTETTTSILKDYNKCADLTFCIEKVDVNADGDVSNIDINQSEACKKIISKKGGGGGGDKSKGTKLLWLWVSLGVVGIILISLISWRLIHARRV